MRITTRSRQTCSIVSTGSAQPGLRACRHPAADSDQLAASGVEPATAERESGANCASQFDCVGDGMPTQQRTAVARPIRMTARMQVAPHSQLQ